MTAKLSTTVNHIRMLTNPKNRQLILQFREFMARNGNSQAYQNNNLKVVTAFSQFLEQTVCLDTIRSKGQIISFLDTKIKGTDEDPDKRWITTWNDYLGRIKFFFRWLHNHYENAKEEAQFSDWETPDFVKIKKKKTKRISPYLDTELWDREDLLNIVKYEPYKRNKAILSLLWDLDARPHEITLLKLKHIRLKEKYGGFQFSYSYC